MPGQRNYSARLIIRQSRFTGVEFAPVPSAAASFSTKPEITRGLRRPVPTPTRWNSISGVPSTCAQSPRSLSLSLSLYLSISFSRFPCTCSPFSACERAVASTVLPRRSIHASISSRSLPPRWIHEVKASGSREVGFYPVIRFQRKRDYFKCNRSGSTERVRSIDVCAPGPAASLTIVFAGRIDAPTLRRLHPCD